VGSSRHSQTGAHGRAAYLDSSVLARSYLPDEEGHKEAVALLEDPDITRVSGKWTRIEVSEALIRAARAGRHKTDEQDLLAVLDADLGDKGRVTELTAPQADVEQKTLELVREHALRALDARHLAVASLTVSHHRIPSRLSFEAVRNSEIPPQPSRERELRGFRTDT
jgi:predicted nucleic acid-binding protein